METLALFAILLGGAAAVAASLRTPMGTTGPPSDAALVEQLQELTEDFCVLVAPESDRLPIRLVVQKEYQGEPRRFALDFKHDPKSWAGTLTTVSYRWPLHHAQTVWFRAAHHGPPDGRVLRVSMKPRVPDPGGLVHAATRRALDYLDARTLAPDLRADERSVRLTLALHHGSPPMVRLLIAIVWNTAVALDPSLVPGAEEAEALRFLTGPQGASVTCQVCGEAAGGAMVACADCATPHHQECWKYMGSCSTYGCGGKRSVAPRTESSGDADRA